jgi:cystathionine beta-lyase/cystathionine gamma-synthase
MKFSTIAIHEGQEPEDSTGAVITPIYQTTTFAQSEPGVFKGYDYSRSGNPTRTALEKSLAKLEGGQYGFAFASGMAALTTLLMALLKSGDHVVVGDDVYGGTFRLFDKVLKKFDIKATFVDMSNTDEVLRSIDKSTKLMFLETPTNPLLKLTDLKEVIALAKNHHLITCVDNTFATPYLQSPLEYDADIVLHSTTKYINGHSDVVGGALITNHDDYAEKIGFFQNSIGGTPDPFASWLTLRGMKTLAVRMDAHVKSATELAMFLESHPYVEQVIYPGLSSHPQYDLAQTQMSGPGGMISLKVKGDISQAVSFIRNLKYFTLAESLGGIESLIEIPAICRN